MTTALPGTLVAAVLLLAGCVVPVGGGQVQGQRITEETLARLEPGRATKSDVFRLLGAPNVVWEDERLLGYQWLVSGGGVMFVNSRDFGTSLQSWKPYAVLVQLDERDVVREVARGATSLAEAYRNYVARRSTEERR